MKRILKLLATLVSLVLISSGLTSPAQADGNWRNGWCYEDEGLAVVVDFTALDREDYGDVAPLGYIVRCIPGAKTETPFKFNSALKYAGIEHEGTNDSVGYVTSIMGVDGVGFTRGFAVNGVWQTQTYMDKCSGINCIQFWVAFPKTAPVVKPQFLKKGGGTKPVTNPTVKPPKQTYTPKPNVTTVTAKPKPKPTRSGTKTKPAPKPVAPGATNQRPVGTNQPTRPGSPTTVRATSSPTQGTTSASPSMSPSTATSAPVSASVTPSPSATSLPSEVYAEESPGATESAIPGENDSGSSSGGPWGWIVGSLLVIAAIAGGIWYTATRKGKPNA